MLVDIIVIIDNGRFMMYGLCFNVSDFKEVVCFFGFEVGDFLIVILKLIIVNVKLDFNGEICNYSFDIIEFGKVLIVNG